MQYQSFFSVEKTKTKKNKNKKNIINLSYSAFLHGVLKNLIDTLLKNEVMMSKQIDMKVIIYCIIYKQHNSADVHSQRLNT